MYGHVIYDKDGIAEQWGKFDFLIIALGSMGCLFLGEIKFKSIAHLNVNGKIRLVEENRIFSCLWHKERFNQTPKVLILKQK